MDRCTIRRENQVTETWKQFLHLSAELDRTLTACLKPSLTSLKRYTRLQKQLEDTQNKRTFR